MPPSKRKARRKQADLLGSSEPDLPDSSPTRPSAKKRKVRFLEQYLTEPQSADM